MNRDSLFLRVENYIAKKQVSKEHDQLFIRIMAKWPDFVFGYFEIRPDKEISTTRYGKAITDEYERILVNQIKKLKVSLTNPLRFFVLYTDGIEYPQEVMDLIEKHIVLLGCYSLPGRLYNELMIPDFNLLGSRDVYQKVVKLATPFSERIPVAKFRGAQTGGMYNMETVRSLKLPRLRAMHIAKDHPDLLDIRFTLTYDIQNNGGEEYLRYMKETFGSNAKYERMDTLTSHRYLLSFDGNGATYARQEMIMASGSVPLFQTRFVKYWSHFLEDGVNYVRIHDDLSNLVRVVQNLNENPKLAEAIASNARALANEVLSPEFQDEYFSYILETISRKIRGGRM